MRKDALFSKVFTGKYWNLVEISKVNLFICFDFIYDPANFKCETNSKVDSLPPLPPQMIPELTAAEESFEERHWSNIVMEVCGNGLTWKLFPCTKSVSWRPPWLEQECCHSHQCLCPARLLPQTTIMSWIICSSMCCPLYIAQLFAVNYILFYFAGGSPKSSMPSIQSSVNW